MNVFKKGGMVGRGAEVPPPPPVPEKEYSMSGIKLEKATDPSLSDVTNLRQIAAEDTIRTYGTEEDAQKGNLNIGQEIEKEFEEADERKKAAEDLFN